MIVSSLHCVTSAFVVLIVSAHLGARERFSMPSKTCPPNLSCPPVTLADGDNLRTGNTPKLNLCSKTFYNVFIECFTSNCWQNKFTKNINSSFLCQTGHTNNTKRNIRAIRWQRCSIIFNWIPSNVWCKIVKVPNCRFPHLFLSDPIPVIVYPCHWLTD